MFRIVPLSIIRSFFTVHTASEQDAARKLSANLHDIRHCCTYSKKTPDDGQRNCPKHVEFYSKNKCKKLVHIFGFIVRTSTHITKTPKITHTTSYRK